MTPRTPLIISIISFLLFLREVCFPLAPGRLLNKIFTCQQIVTNSFPCYGNYDIAIVILSFGIFTISLGWWMWKRPRKTKK